MHSAGEAPPDDTPGVDAWAVAALAELSALPAVRRAGLALLEGGGRRLRFTASDRVGTADARWCHVDAYDDVPLNTAVRTGRVVVGTLAELRASYPAFVDGQDDTVTGAVAAVPITSAGQVLGGYVLYLADLPGEPADVVARLSAQGATLGRALRSAQHARGRSTSSDEWLDDIAPGARVARFGASADVGEVGRARHFLQDALEGWTCDADVIHTAVLCLSELVTNAVVHGTGGCSVRVTDESGVLTVAVRNAGPTTPVSPPDTDDPLAVHGRGLRLVATLATRWGSELDVSGVTVWFVLDP